MSFATAIKAKKNSKESTTDSGQVTSKGGQGQMDMGMASKGIRKLGGIDIPEHYFHRFTTGISVIDDLINGDGLVPGQCFTLDAPRGGGKTTLLLQIMQGVITYNNGMKRCLYLSGEEYVEQLAYMSQRINTPDVEADNVVEVDEIVKLTTDYDVIVIDSLASLKHEGLRSRHSIEEYAVNEIVKSAKQNKCAVFFIQHQTKDGKSCGKSAIQHTVDTCLKIYNMDPEQFGASNVKCITVDKNRFGGSGEVIMAMKRDGWDFNNPIDNNTHNDDNKSQNTSGRAAQKTKDFNKLLKIMEDKGSKGATLAELANEIGDVGRTERLLKELSDWGKVVKVGRAKQAVYKGV
jgi:predicted ATP-dependent serine protease